MTKHELFPLACCLLSLLALLAAEAQPPEPQPQNQGNCTYKITIETTCHETAGTLAKVRMRFQDDQGNEVVISDLRKKYVQTLQRATADPEEELKDLAVKPFQRCMVDEFQETQNCVQSKISVIFLKVIGADDDWRPGTAFVEFVNNTDLKSPKICFRKKLPPNEWDRGDPCEMGGDYIEIKKPGTSKKFSYPKKH